MKQISKFQQTEIGMIPDDWDVEEINNIAKINEMAINKSFTFKEIEYIDINSVDKGIIANPKRMLIEDSPSRAKRIVRVNDIIISTVRPKLKHFAFIKKVNPNTIVSTGFAVITSKTVNPKFLFYYVTTDNFTNYLSANADSHTSTYPAFNPNIIEKSKIPYPSIPEQSAIASILSFLDSKIELNQEMNKTLEAISQALFKHWFMDFEFPDEKGRPYKSSGGEMVESELGEMPGEWKIGSLLEIATLLSGGTPKTANEEYWDGTIDWVSASDVTKSNGTYILSTERKISDIGLKNSNAKMLSINTTIITARGTVGNYCLLGKDMTINQTNYGLKGKQGENYFIFFMVSKVIPFLQQHSYGTVFDTITTKTFESMRIIIPPDELIKKFDLSISSLMSSLKTNIEENQSLISIRDSLLPKLMSGQIRVPVEVKAC